MERLNKKISKAVERPVKVLQFGEGNFLRAFVDYMFDVVNEKTDFNGSIVIVKPIGFGSLDRFHEQECQYTLQLRGMVDGEAKKDTRIITTVSDAVCAYNDYEKYAAYAKLDSLRFIVSNTTEAGIVFDETDELDAMPPKTYPNAGAVLVLGLGCENSRIEVMKKYIGEVNSDRVKFLQVQDVEDEQEAAANIMEELMNYAATFKRERVSAKELIIGMKCGGSDGLSGITANPVVGLFSDKLVSKGGTTILTEVPEMFGAETILMDRCANETLFDKTVCLINDFKDYFIKNGQEIYENPSPGNKDGGITTLEDKSLGCTQKSGTSLVKGVLAYGEKVNDKGLNLFSAQGNDLVVSTAYAAAGAQIVLFTTGRGTPFASPVPTVKISTNTNLAGKKSNWIDFNAGRIISDDVPMEKLAEELFQLVLDVASGKKVKAELDGFHDLAIFKQGVTL